MKSSGQYALEGLEVRRSGGLIDRAIAALREGPQSTEELARRVMGIKGSPPAAASAIFTLLGSDTRFAVDGSGIWRLADLLPSPPSRSLRDEDWVVVDVETTGGSARHGHRVTEVAAVCVSGGEISHTYSTLVNPQRRIPSMITALTGITNEMVQDAPPFCDVVDDLNGVLQGRVFVAHNAAFDWGFLCSEMERTVGSRLDGRQLCTVRLARRLLPELPSRSLDSLAHYFNLEIESRHRALDDAVATAQLLLHLLERLEGMNIHRWEEVQRFLTRRTRSSRRRRATPRSMDSA